MERNAGMLRVPSAAGSGPMSPRCSTVREHQPRTWQFGPHRIQREGRAGTNPQPDPGKVAQQHVGAGEPAHHSPGSAHNG
jgi:hypothetical protein